jgi:hypothetical protein
MENSPPILSILITCFSCLCCLVVIAAIVAVIVVVVRRRKSESPDLQPPAAPSAPADSFIPTGPGSFGSAEPEMPEEASPAGYEPTAAYEPVVPPAPPEPPVEPYAAQTMISSKPVFDEPPATDEKDKNPFKPGSVAAASFDVGFDIRDLKMMGFTDDEMYKYKREEIQAVWDGKMSLEELRKRYQG